MISAPPLDPNSEQRFLGLNGHSQVHSDLIRAQATPTAEFQPVDILHSLRRRGWVAAMIAFPLSIGLALVAFTLQESSFRSSALLRLASTENNLVFDGNEDRAEFELFQGTQRELVSSRLVMTAALRNPNLAQSRVITQEEFPVEWMLDNIHVQTPSATEIMTISTETTDPDESVEIVNAVVDAFLIEVVNRQRGNRQDRLDDIDRVFEEKQAELRRKRNELKRLTEQLGTSDSDVLSIQQQFLVQELGDLRRQLVTVQTRLWSAQASRSSLLASMEHQEEAGNDPVEPSLEDIEAALIKDPIYMELLRDKMTAFRLESEADAAFKEESDSPYERIQQFVDEELLERRRQIEQEIKQFAPMQYSQQVVKSRRRMQEESRQIEAEISVLTALEQRLANQVSQLKGELGNIGNRSVDVEMMRSEIAQLDEVSSSIAQQREQLKVELRSKPRVEVLRRAEEAEPANNTKRYALSGAAGLLGLVLPIGLLGAVDLLVRRVDSSSMLSQRTGLPILGSVPVIPPSIIRAGRRKTTRRSFYWQQRLAESVRRLAGRLLIWSKRQETQLMVVTSACRAEGKTTIATQLATSLAHCQKKVLLVDLDIRTPALHRVYGIENDQGVCEVLRGEVDLFDAVQATQTENLSVLVAGNPCDEALRTLAREKTSALMKEFRSLADLVILDCGPVLAAADVECVSPYADGVMFAVRRDKSKLPDVKTAVEHLRQADAKILGAVVIEPERTDTRPGVDGSNWKQPAKSKAIDRKEPTTHTT